MPDHDQDVHLANRAKEKLKNKESKKEDDSKNTPKHYLIGIGQALQTARHGSFLAVPVAVFGVFIWARENFSHPWLNFSHPWIDKISPSKKVEVIDEEEAEFLVIPEDPEEEPEEESEEESEEE